MNFLKSNRLRNVAILTTSLLMGTLSAVNQASANPVNVSFVDDNRCDAPGNQLLTEELGGTAANLGSITSTPFDADEWISWTVAPAGVACTGQAGGGNDWLVSITNKTINRSFSNLFFVTDAPGNNTVGNADGKILGFDAFRIDARGVNNNLLFESIATDEIFQPGETWQFLVSDFVSISDNPGQAAGSPYFGSLGIGSTSLDSNANIVTVVPEPTSTISFLALGILGAGATLKRKLK